MKGDEIILKAAQRAFERVPFYQQLYRERPESVEQVVSINYADYHQAAGVLDCINRSAELCGTLPPFHRAFRRLPFTVLESEADVDLRQERLALALEDIGIAGPMRMLLVTDEENGPFACDLSTGVGWEGHPASIYYHTGSDEDLKFQVAAHRPDWLVWCVGRERLPEGLFAQERTLLVHHLDRTMPEWNGALWLVCDELNLLGSRPSGRAAFRVAQEQFLIEKGPAGKACITTQQHDVFPLVRYELAQSFEVMV